MTWGARGVTVRFGDRAALDGVTLDVPAGEVTAVVGGDGAGKTTLLRVLAGALAVTTGEVRRPGVGAIGYLPASSGTYPDLSVVENVEFAAGAYGLSRAESRSRGAPYLERAGLAPFGDRLAGHLSGGMRQKLGVVRALVHRPELVVLDEPTTGIDPVSRADLWWMIARAAAGGAAVVFATTYLDEAERATRLLVLDDGHPLAAGSPASIVAAMPGTLRSQDHPPPGTPAAVRTWRRGRHWRTWTPDPDPGGGSLVEPDLQDAAIALALARETEAAAPPEAAPSPSPNLGPSRTQNREVAPVAESRGCTRRFGDFVAVGGVDLVVAPGEVVGLLGANGAGKTTLIRLLLGLLHPSEGEARLFGEPPSIATRGRLGYVPQSLGLYDDLTAAENLAFHRAVFGAGSDGLPADLAGVAEVPVGRLSLGLQRRLAFVAALGHRPDLLVLDEPTSGVGPLARARLWEAIHAAADGGAGVLVTTHHMEEAEECDRLAVMATGRVVAEGTVAEIVGDATVTVVETRDLGPALDALDRAGIAGVALVGRTLRVIGAGPGEVRRALGAAGRVHLHPTPATLDERFFQLVTG